MILSEVFSLEFITLVLINGSESEAFHLLVKVPVSTRLATLMINN